MAWIFYTKITATCIDFCIKTVIWWAENENTEEKCFRVLQNNKALKLRSGCGDGGVGFRVLQNNKALKPINSAVARQAVFQSITK